MTKTPYQLLLLLSLCTIHNTFAIQPKSNLLPRKRIAMQQDHPNNTSNIAHSTLREEENRQFGHESPTANELKTLLKTVSKVMIVTSLFGTAYSVQTCNAPLSPIIGLTSLLTGLRILTAIDNPTPQKIFQTASLLCMCICLSSLRSSP